MRLWTLHPKYLDRQGLLAVWREGLLAQAVLAGKTKGYKNHPQLARFKAQPDPLGAIAYFLHEVHQEATRRGYKFDRSKYELDGIPPQVDTTAGQLDFEIQHLGEKLKRRSPDDHARFHEVKKVEPHPIFRIVPGEVEVWERGSENT